MKIELVDEDESLRLLFTGTFCQKTDSRGKLLIPKRLRDPLPGSPQQLFLLALEDCIRAYSEQTLRFAQNPAEGMSMCKRLELPYECTTRRVFFPNLYKYDLDYKGRLYPLKCDSAVYDIIHPSESLVLTGQGDHFTIARAE